MRHLSRKESWRPLLLNSRSKTPVKVILAEEDHVITDSRLVAECLNSLIFC